MFSNENKVFKIDSNITPLEYNPLKIVTNVRLTPGGYIRIFTVNLHIPTLSPSMGNQNELQADSTVSMFGMYSWNM